MGKASGAVQAIVRLIAAEAVLVSTTRGLAGRDVIRCMGLDCSLSSGWNSKFGPNEQMSQSFLIRKRFANLWSVEDLHRDVCGLRASFLSFQVPIVAPRWGERISRASGT